jgi:EEF1A lysine methyltransferase 4
VIEKSCTDAIACGEDVAIVAPYSLSGLSEKLSISVEGTEKVHIHPVCILAVHLAALTRPGGKWIAFSYSTTRFDCLYCDEDADESYVEKKKNGMIPDPAKLWKMERKEEWVVNDAAVEGVCRPKISHWLYVLQRTELEVY